MRIRVSNEYPNGCFGHVGVLLANMWFFLDILTLLYNFSAVQRSNSKFFKHRI